MLITAYARKSARCFSRICWNDYMVVAENQDFDLAQVAPSQTFFPVRRRFNKLALFLNIAKAYRRVFFDKKTDISKELFAKKHQFFFLEHCFLSLRAYGKSSCVFSHYLHTDIDGRLTASTLYQTHCEAGGVC